MSQVSEAWAGFSPADVCLLRHQDNPAPIFPPGTSNSRTPPQTPHTPRPPAQTSRPSHRRRRVPRLRHVQRELVRAVFPGTRGRAVHRLMRRLHKRQVGKVGVGRLRWPVSESVRISHRAPTNPVPRWRSLLFPMLRTRVSRGERRVLLLPPCRQEGAEILRSGAGRLAMAIRL